MGAANEYIVPPFRLADVNRAALAALPADGIPDGLHIVELDECPIGDRECGEASGDADGTDDGAARTSAGAGGTSAGAAGSGAGAAGSSAGAAGASGGTGAEPESMPPALELAASSECIRAWLKADPKLRPVLGMTLALLGTKQLRDPSSLAQFEEAMCLLHAVRADQGRNDKITVKQASSEGCVVSTRCLLLTTRHILRTTRYSLRRAARRQPTRARR